MSVCRDEQPLQPRQAGARTPTQLNRYSLQWRHNERDGVSNHQPHDCLLNRLFRHRSMKTSKLRVTGLCEGNSPVTGEFPAQRARNTENVTIWWRHHVFVQTTRKASQVHLQEVDVSTHLVSLNRNGFILDPVLCYKFVSLSTDHLKNRHIHKSAQQVWSFSCSACRVYPSKCHPKSCW